MRLEMRFITDGIPTAHSREITTLAEGLQLFGEAWTATAAEIERRRIEREARAAPRRGGA